MTDQVHLRGPDGRDILPVIEQKIAGQFAPYYGSRLWQEFLRFLGWMAQTGEPRITARAVRDYHSFRQLRERNDSSVKRLKAACGAAYAAGAIPHEEWEAIAAGRIDPPFKLKRSAKATIFDFLAAPRDLDHEALREAAVIALLCCEMRPQEISRLTPGNLHTFANGRMEAQMDSRNVMLPPRAQNVLEAWLGRQRGGETTLLGCSILRIHKILRKYNAALFGEGRRGDLRYAHAKLWLEAKAPWWLVAKRLGFRSEDAARKFVKHETR